MHSPATSAPAHRAANLINSGLCVIKDHVLPTANEPRHNECITLNRASEELCPLLGCTPTHQLASLVWCSSMDF
jgi:hypothetical protein